MQNAQRREKERGFGFLDVAVCQKLVMYVSERCELSEK
jgi:hypothetical protein